MRIALVSDIHGNLPALEAVVADFSARGADTVINLGDSLSGPLLPLETAHYLMAREWTQLAGNHERQILGLSAADPATPDGYARSQLGAAELAWISSLPPTLAYSDEITLCHGTPANDLEYFLETADHGCVRVASPAEVRARLGGIRTAVVACGHTHVPRSVRSPDGQLIVNPGSVGLPAFDDDHGGYHVVENASTDARYALIEKGARGWTTQLVSVPYDHEAMARLAGRRGFKDWEHALRTGYALRIVHADK